MDTGGRDQASTLSKLTNRMRFPKDDPLRDLHVPKRQRLDDDGGRGSDALDDQTGDDADFDRDAVRANTTVIPPELLQ